MGAMIQIGQFQGVSVRSVVEDDLTEKIKRMSQRLAYDRSVRHTDTVEVNYRKVNGIIIGEVIDD